MKPRRFAFVFLVFLGFGCRVFGYKEITHQAIIDSSLKYIKNDPVLKSLYLEMVDKQDDVVNGVTIKNPYWQELRRGVFDQDNKLQVPGLPAISPINHFYHPLSEGYLNFNGELGNVPLGWINWNALDWALGSAVANVNDWKDAISAYGYTDDKKKTPITSSATWFMCWRI